MISKKEHIPKNNYFTILRYIGALFVILSHSYPLTNGRGTSEPLTDHLGGLSIGAVGVSFFFVMSGFLLVENLKKEPIRYSSLVGFLCKRILRILPELIGVLLFTVFLIGPMTTSLGIVDYFINKETWMYLINPITIFFNSHLPGVFETNPYPNVVNGSLWILPYFIIMYLIFWVFVVLGFLNKPPIILFLHVLAFLVLIFSSRILPSIHELINLPFITDKLSFQYYLYFSGGIIISIYKKFIKSQIIIANIILLVLIITAFFQKTLIYYIYIAIIPYSLFYLSICSIKIMRLCSDIEDYSYGLYIYAWPIQQTIAHFIKNISVCEILLYTIMIIIPLAFLSRRLIEDPALKWGNRSNC
jgi:peptidoglycan/LPS O-acetylase OafA/YrhL